MEAGFVPAAIVYLGLEGGMDTPTLLSQEALDSAQSALQAEVAIADKRGWVITYHTHILTHTHSHTHSLTHTHRSQARHSFTKSYISYVTTPTQVSDGVENVESAAIGRTVPKWFKLGV